MIKTLRSDPNLKTLPDQAIESLVDRMIKDDHVVMEKCGFAFYVKCDDELLAKIQAHKEYLIYPDLAQKLIGASGKHVHFIGVYSTTPESDGFQSILKGMDHIVAKENPESISWYDRNLAKFIIRRI